MYPKAGIVGWGHHNIPWSLLGRLESGADSSMLEQLITEIDGAHQNKIILSSEEISPLPENNIEKLKERLNKYDIKIIVYLRRQDAYFPSLYGEAVRSKEQVYSNDFNTFFKKCQQEGNYYNLVKKFEKEFGKKNIIIREYDAQDDFDLINDFLISVGVNKAEYDRKDYQCNLGNNYRSIAMLSFINKLLNKLNLKNKQHIKRSLLSSSLFNSMAMAFPISQIPNSHEIMNLYKSSNEKLCFEYGVSLFKSQPKQMQFSPKKKS